MDLLRCLSCRGLFDPVPPSPDGLRERYQGERYFVKDGEGQSSWGYPADYLGDRPMIEAKFNRVLEHLERYTEPGRLLDVGCGPGFMLTVARRRGWRAVGVDLNRWATEYGREVLDVDIRGGDLEEAEFDETQFDAVTMLDVVEHSPDPAALIAEAGRLLRPGGALVIVTPDAGAAVSRALGSRWPEVRRGDEHPVLFSIEGLAALLGRHGFAPSGRHSVGKTTTVATLLADVSPAAPRLSASLRRLIGSRAIGARTVAFDPRTKVCLYARRLPAGARRRPMHRPARLPKRAAKLAAMGDAIAVELEALAAAQRLCDWMFDRFAGHVHGDVAEVGAGLGTFSQRIIDRGARSLLAIEPDQRCAAVLARRFRGDPRVEAVCEALPDSPTLAARSGGFDLVVCQNVLEHIPDDVAAVTAMADALHDGGRLALLVPADPSLFGPLDDAYGHWRRYRRAELAEVVAGGGLLVESLRPVNALGIPGWGVKNLRAGARIGRGALKVYEALLPLWRPIEDRIAPSRGLSLFCLARKGPAARSSPVR